MATIQIKTDMVFTDVFGKPVTIIDVKQPVIDDLSKPKKEDGTYHQKHNTLEGTFLKIVVFSLVETIRKQTENGGFKTNVKSLEDSIKYGKLAEKIVLASTTKTKTVDIICGGKDDEQSIIQDAVHEYYENVEIDSFLAKLFA